MPLFFTWHMSYDPQGEDRELIDLLNLTNTNLRG